MKNSDNKYYTPEIEEFHIGFEYEYKYHGIFGYLDNTKGYWAKETFAAGTIEEDTDEIECIENLLNLKDINEGVRVKHLDREDIESLDWELDSCARGEYAFYHKTQSLMTKNMHFLQWDKKEEHNILISDINNKQGTEFVGTIKNKSELKRLLIQLGVIQI